MAAVGVRALQQNAAEVLRRVSAGEVVEVTERGRPVAQLSPVTQSRLDMLLATGQASPARRRIVELPPPLVVAREGASLSDLLAEARADER